MVHSVQNPWSWLTGRIFGFLISVRVFLFPDFVFDRETAEASENGWFLLFFTQVLKSSLSILLLCLDCVSNLVHDPFPSGGRKDNSQLDYTFLVGLLVISENKSVKANS